MSKFCHNIKNDARRAHEENKANTEKNCIDSSISPKNIHFAEHNYMT